MASLTDFKYIALTLSADVAKLLSTILPHRESEADCRVDAVIRCRISILGSFIKLLRTLTFCLDAMKRKLDVFWPVRRPWGFIRFPSLPRRGGSGRLLAADGVVLSR